MNINRRYLSWGHIVILISSIVAILSLLVIFAYVRINGLEAQIDELKNAVNTSSEESEVSESPEAEATPNVVLVNPVAPWEGTVELETAYYADPITEDPAGTIQPGAKFTVSAISNDRYFITLENGQDGYVPMSAVLQGEQAVGDPTPPPSASPSPETTIEQTFEKAEADNSSGFSSAQTTPKPTAAPTMKPTVKPTAVPTSKPTVKPTPVPTTEPTPAPTATPVPEVQEISLDTDNVTISVGESCYIGVFSAPQSHYDRGAMWASGNSGVASLSGSGTSGVTVTGVSSGTTIITVYSRIGLSASCTVTVN